MSTSQRSKVCTLIRSGMVGIVDIFCVFLYLVLSGMVGVFVFGVIRNGRHSRYFL
jgi:hypothetical protein